MIIAFTGTPGTGKSSICSYLKKKYRIIDLNWLIKNEGLNTGRDKQRGSLIADMDALQKRVDELISHETTTVIIEGHLSHHLKGPDAVIVLRTRPSVLTRRLWHRGYLPEKITENIEAEALDVILIESMEQHHTVYEVETTTSTPEDTSLTIRSLISLLEAGDYDHLKPYLPGRFDWSDEVFYDPK
jgi:adenylate kinase